MILAVLIIATDFESFQKVVASQFYTLFIHVQLSIQFHQILMTTCSYVLFSALDGIVDFYEELMLVCQAKLSGQDFQSSYLCMMIRH